MSQVTRPARRTFGRLSLEQLEAREVPATLRWMGVNDDFADSRNWKVVDGVGGGPPGAGDVVQLYGQWSPWYMTPTPNRDLTFPSDSGRSFVGIEIVNGYSGTVTFPADVTFSRYTQTTGTTAQAAGTAVTVTSNLTWTGGSVNATSNAATYKLLGASGQIGDDTTALTSGSKFVIESTGTPGTSGFKPGTATQAGTLTMNNDGSNIEVGEDAVFNQQRINWQAPVAPVLQANAPWENTDTGGVVVMGRFNPLGGKVKFVRVAPGGTLDIDIDSRGGSAGLIVTGQTSGGFGVRSYGWVMIRNGLTLTATNGVRIAGSSGKLTTYTASSPTPQIATIDGRLRFEGDEINLGMGDTDPKGVVQERAYSTLMVTKYVELWGGAFFPRISETVVTDRDAIQTQDTFSIVDFSISPVSVNVLPATVLVSANGFVDNTDPINPNPNLWTMTRSADGKSFTVKKA